MAESVSPTVEAGLETVFGHPQSLLGKKLPLGQSGTVIVYLDDDFLFDTPIVVCVKIFKMFCISIKATIEAR